MKRGAVRKQAAPPLAPAHLEALAGSVAWLMGVRTPASVHVSFVSNRVLQRLKWKYLRRRAAFVDVLAFREPRGFPHPESRRRVLGEVYLNDIYRRGRADDGLRMFIHGMAHLCGFNHQGRRDTMEMEAVERRALAWIRSVRGRYRFIPHRITTQHENSHRA